MQIAKSSAWLLAGQLLVSLVVLSINWLVIGGLFRSSSMLILVSTTLATLLRGQAFLKKGETALAWGMTLVPPLILLIEYSALRTMGLR